MAMEAGGLRESILSWKIVIAASFFTKVSMGLHQRSSLDDSKTEPAQLVTHAPSPLHLL
jgi:hypothetical protein